MELYRVRAYLGRFIVVLLGLCFFIPFIYSQITLETQILNGIPDFSSVQTYDRYANATDNFPLQNFSICIGESDRTILMRFIARDGNSNVEIQNVTWKIVSIIDGIDTIIPSFGSSFKQATFDTTVSGTEFSYMENITLTNNGTKRTYKITTNVTDIYNDSSINVSFFTLQKSDCIRVEQNASLVESEPFEVHVDYCELDIVVNENVTGRIIVTLHNDSPVDNNSPNALNKYITVDVEGVILQETINLSLITNYSDFEVEGKGIDESSLRLYKFGSWNLQEGNVNTSINEVLLVVNETTIADNYSYRLGTYSIRGTLESEAEESSEESSVVSGGGSGGGGGGGGGGSFGSPREDNPSRKSSSGGGRAVSQDGDNTSNNYKSGINDTEENRNINKEYLYEYLDSMDLFNYLYSQCFLYIIIIVFLLLMFLREWKLRRDLEKRFLKKKSKTSFTFWMFLHRLFKKRDHATKYCYHCGKKIERAAQFCEYCGKKQLSK